MLPALFCAFWLVNQLYRSIPDPFEIPDLETVDPPTQDDETAQTAPLDAADVDERRAWLDDDPDLERLEDTHVWDTVDWDQPPPVRPENRHRILPEEDVRRVVAQTCLVCTDQCLFASTLACTHMICVNCAENKAIKDCPICRAPKKVVATSHVGSLVLERAEDIPEIRIAREPAPSERPVVQQSSGPDSANARPSGSTGTASERNVAAAVAPPSALRSRVARSRNEDAINSVLRDDGHEDPDRYRAELRRQNRTRRPRGVYVRPGLSQVDQDEVRRESEDEDDPEVPPADGPQEETASTFAEDGEGRQDDERTLLRYRAAEAAERRQVRHPAASTATEADHQVPPAREESMDEYDRLVHSQTYPHPSNPAASSSQGSTIAGQDADSDESDNVVLSQYSLRNRVPRRSWSFIDEPTTPPRGRKRARRH